MTTPKEGRKLSSFLFAYRHRSATCGTVPVGTRLQTASFPRRQPNPFAPQGQTDFFALSARSVGPKTRQAAAQAAVAVRDDGNFCVGR